ncbi:MAG TPA: M48 family metalloprotease, partial [Vicinamibacteria bacterium]
VRFEPEQTEARPGIVGMVVTAAGLALVLGALARGLAAWRATVRLVREWRRGSEPFPITAPAPAFVLDHAFPVVAVVGILRPRLFLARSVVAALTPEELRAVLAHEAGHLAARDNLKRLALRFMPTLGWSRLAGRLEERWEAEAEARADGAAGPEAALELASALLKTARLAPPGTRLTLPVAAFHSGHGVAERVQGLLEAPGTEESRRWSPARLWFPLTALAIAAAAAVLPLVHDLSEFLIHLP